MNRKIWICNILLHSCTQKINFRIGNPFMVFFISFHMKVNPLLKNLPLLLLPQHPLLADKMQWIGLDIESHLK